MGYNLPINGVFLGVINQLTNHLLTSNGTSKWSIRPRFQARGWLRFGVPTLSAFGRVMGWEEVNLPIPGPYKLCKDSDQGYNLYKWVICPLTRVINLHITSYIQYPDPLSTNCRAKMFFTTTSSPLSDFGPCTIAYPSRTHGSQ